MHNSSCRKPSINHPPVHSLPSHSCKVLIVSYTCMVSCVHFHLTRLLHHDALNLQIHSMIGKLGQFTDITAALIVGGLSLSVQAATLRKGPEIVVATPGRMIDHLRNTQVRCMHVIGQSCPR